MLTKKLYFVSTNPDLEKELILPSIPNNFLVKQKAMDWKIPRIPLYTTIDDAISGGQFLNQNLKGKSLFVYIASNFRPSSILTPSIDSVPYLLILDEKWYCYPLRLKKEMEITVKDKINEEYYRYGTKSIRASIIHWSWEEQKSIKPWEEKLNMKLKKKLFSKKEDKVDENIGNEENPKKSYISPRTTEELTSTHLTPLVDKNEKKDNKDRENFREKHDLVDVETNKETNKDESILDNLFNKKDKKDGGSILSDLWNGTDDQRPLFNKKQKFLLGTAGVIAILAKMKENRHRRWRNND